MRRDLFIWLFLFVAVLAVFSQVRNHDFVNYDDNAYVTDNPRVKAGLTLKGVSWAFKASHAANWHPLTWLSHMLDCQLFGLNPKGHHLTNLVFHLLNTLLLFYLLNRMTGARWRSLFVALLFALHPLHVESVVWVAERKDVLSTLFWMLTVWAYLRYVEQPGLMRYVLTILAFALGLMAKPMLVTLPFVLLLLDYWPLRRFQVGPISGSDPPITQTTPAVQKQISQGIRLAWEKAPLFTLAALSSLVTFFVQQRAGAVESMVVFPLKVRFANALVSYVKYMGKMIWPQGLAVFYPHPGNSLPEWQVVGAFLLLTLLSLLAVRTAYRYPYVLVGWLWYLGTLVPAIGLVQVGEQALADRYTYVPLIGLFIIIAWGGPDLIRRWRYGPPVLATSTVIVLLAMFTSTWLQVGHWKNSIDLFEHTIRVTANNYPAHNNLGVALEQQERLQGAIAHYEEALRLKPNYVEAHNNMGHVLGLQGEFQEAIAHYEEALRINPEHARTHFNLGVAAERQGKFQQALAHYEDALRFKPDYVEAHNNMGILRATQGKFQEAIDHYLHALRINPEHARTHYNLGVAAEQQGKLQEAVAYYEQALRIKPDFVEVHNNLGNVLGQQGKFEGAISHFSRALELKPNSAETHYNMGNVLAGQGKLEKATSHFSKALELEPDFAQAYNNMGAVLSFQGKYREAIACFSQALRLKPHYAEARKNLEFVQREASRLAK